MCLRIVALIFRVKEKPQTRRKKMISLRRSTENVRRLDAPPCTQFVLQVHRKGMETG